EVLAVVSSIVMYICPMYLCTFRPLYLCPHTLSPSCSLFLFFPCFFLPRRSTGHCTLLVNGWVRVDISLPKTQRLSRPSVPFPSRSPLRAPAFHTLFPPSPLAPPVPSRASSGSVKPYHCLILTSPLAS